MNFPESIQFCISTTCIVELRLNHLMFSDSGTDPMTP